MTTIAAPVERLVRLRVSCDAFHSNDLCRGVEPDSAFLIGPAVDPPPDLMIEVDITRSSRIRFPVVAAFETSPALPPLTGRIASEFLKLPQWVGSIEWLRQVRAWAREARKSG